MVELTDDTFDAHVLAKDAGVWFVRFYAPVRSSMQSHSCS